MLSGSWKIAKVWGIPIRLHFSWFVVFGLITWSLATRYFPYVAPELTETAHWLRGAVAALLLFLSVIVHELSHSFVARHYKLPITSITLFIFGGVAQMEQEPSSPKVEFQMAIAGPFSSYLLAAVFSFMYRLTPELPGLNAIAFYLFQLNLILGTFNLIPGFPMDGGRVLRALLWKRSGDYLYATRKASKTGQGIALFFIFLGILSLLGGYTGSLWFLLIGWFLYMAAQSSYQQASIRGILSGVKVGDVMTGDVVAVSLSTTVSDLVEKYFLRYGYGGFPVVDSGRAAGIVNFKAINEVTRDKWPAVTASDIMRPIDDSIMAREGDELSVILERMIRDNESRFLVLEGGELRGIITRSGIARYIKVKGNINEQT
jgi:Zn-dependent protease